jgi:hypothetical protein
VRKFNFVTVKASKSVDICKGDVAAENLRVLTLFMRWVNLKFKYLSCES